MKARSICALAVLLVTSATAADPASVDRTIRKEPSYQHKPSYCLLVIGSEAQSRVWVVKDGDTIHVDRNANGDLTDSGEAIKPAKAREVSSSYRDTSYDIGTLVAAGTASPHTDFKITGYTTDNRVWNYVFKLKVNETLQQFAGWKPVFADTREQAPVLHFGGPLIVQTLRFPKFSLKEPKPELHLRFATPGLGESSTVSLGYEAVPASIQPVAHIEWPGSNKSTSVKLLSRC